ncbi:MAG: hypothetical protein EP330_00460 [Deltaproteobacteria bacterium]|nr:MAG: hypothetical protein EP330_00460 [Deltaproteobacteria bacterium]
MILAMLLLGCPKPPQPTEVSPGWIEAREDEEVPVPVGTGEWLGNGVSLWVAPGWRGEHTQGPPERLSLRDGETDTTLVVELGVEDIALPRHCTAVFEDAGRYRSVALDELRTASCVEEDGALLQVWVGRAEFVAVRVVARYPQGQAIRGKQRVEAILPTISPAGGA